MAGSGNSARRHAGTLRKSTGAMPENLDWVQKNLEAL